MEINYNINILDVTKIVHSRQNNFSIELKCN